MRPALTIALLAALLAGAHAFSLDDLLPDVTCIYCEPRVALPCSFPRSKGLKGQAGRPAGHAAQAPAPRAAAPPAPHRPPPPPRRALTAAFSRPSHPAARLQATPAATASRTRC